MDQTHHSGRRHFLARGGAAAVACVGLHALLAPAASATGADYATEAQNLANFDQLDFEGWNGPDWDLFRRLHTDDVIVEIAGQRTEGIEAHLAWAQGFIAAFPDAKILDHPIKLAQGDWTSVIGVLTGGSKMVTVAKWCAGAIAEEYIFTG